MKREVKKERPLLRIGWWIVFALALIASVAIRIRLFGIPLVGLVNLFPNKPSEYYLPLESAPPPFRPTVFWFMNATGNLRTLRPPGIAPHPLCPSRA
jgi:hypothetical protein